MPVALFARGPKGAAIAGLIVGFPGTLFFGFVGLGIITAFLGIGAATTATVAEAERARVAAQADIQDQSPELRKQERSPSEVDMTTTQSESHLQGAHPRMEIKVLFDIPSLLGKSINEIRSILGEPADNQKEPTDLQLQTGFDEWSNVFVHQSQSQEELLVTFDPRTRVVKDFFIGGNDRNLLVQQANLSEENSAYRIEIVKAFGTPTEITGIKIVPIPTHTVDSGSPQAADSAVQAISSEKARWRVWTTANGRYSVEAKFVTFLAGKVTLEKQDGAKVDVPLDLLCQEDQDFVRQQKWKTGASP
jgi:hypothetical protein